MRYRRQRTIKAALLFLGACFIGGLFLHSNTDSARNEDTRNKCNGPWCAKDSPIVAGGMPVEPVPTDHAIRERVINDLVRHRELDHANEAAVAARAAADAAVEHDKKHIVNDLVRHHEIDHANEAAVAARAAADAAVDPDKGIVDKNLQRRLVDKFNPANPDNILPEKKQTVGASIGSTEKTNKGDLKEVKGAVQVAPPKDVAAAAGAGEMGKPFIVDDAHKNESAKLFKINSFNLFASDRISLNRTVPDIRPEGCASLNYPKNLPKTTLVVVFHNEAWSTLWRTVHSAINRSPSCLQEVVLVDDASTQDHLKSKLDRYAIELNFDIKVLHLEKRSGLTVARLRGANVATGEILVFLDSHCEVADGWLEPMAYRIAQDRSHVVVPVIDVIDDDTLEYLKGDGTPQIGGFSWGLIFNWQGMQKPDRLAWNKNKTIPIRSPTMAGGLFAINKAFFNHIGGYDEGFKVWGGENLELSFKTWMCGGTLETMPCSHVGHIFRHSAPYSSGGAGNFMTKNNHRLAEVWLDDYKEFFYFFNPNVRHADGGDISERLAIRKKLNCKSFGWYINNVFPETHWPTSNTKFGKVTNPATGYCLEFNAHDKDGNPVHARPCTEGLPPQLWAFTDRGEIKHDDKCMDSPREDSVVLFGCHFAGGNQKWTYQNETQQIVHANGRCLDLTDIKSKSQPTMSACDTSKLSQKWALDMKVWNLNKSFEKNVKR